ncbi:Egl nine 3, partial [Quaeritorhiza haematococci]
MDIAPKLDRMVVFRSDLEHEVLPTLKDRFALTMWLYADFDIMPYLQSYISTPSPLSTQSSLDRAEPPTIFVSVPSYRDPDTHNTIHSLLLNATHPHLISIGILYQDHPTLDTHIHSSLPLPTPLFPGQIRVERVSSLEAKGPTWAREVIARKLWKGEECVFFVDSHMRFAKEWDVRVVALLREGQRRMREMRRLREGIVNAGEEEKEDLRNEKALITTYPPPFEPPNHLCPPPWNPVVLYPKKFDED